MKVKSEKFLDFEAERTLIMGVLNITPDSFSDGGMYMDASRAVDRAFSMIKEGADIIDIGGESSRPGSEPILPDEELKRVMPVIEAIRKRTEIPLSIDTYKEKVARQALIEGASIVNDITGLRADGKIARTIAEFDAGVILMHMKGNPKNMQNSPFYEDVMDEILFSLSESIALAEHSGIDPKKIIVDPGIGFGKTLDHNLIILRELHKLKTLNKPILVGTSRKSFIGQVTGKDVLNRTFGTAASVSAAIMNGANIIRVHDISQMRDVVRVIDSVMAKEAKR